MQVVVEADFNCGEVVVAAAEGEAFARKGGVGAGELGNDVVGGGGGLVIEVGEAVRDGDGVQGGAGVGEEGLW